MAITVTPPASMDTPLKRWRWAHRADNRLMALHNWMGGWHTQGKTLTQYNNVLPDRVKNKFPYVPQLSAAQWERFVVWHHRLTQQIHAIMHDNRPLLPNKNDAKQSAMQAEITTAQNDAALTVDFDASVAEN